MSRLELKPTRVYEDIVDSHPYTVMGQNHYHILPGEKVLGGVDGIGKYWLPYPNAAAVPDSAYVPYHASGCHNCGKEIVGPLWHTDSYYMGADAHAGCVVLRRKMQPWRRIWKTYEDARVRDIVAFQIMDRKGHRFWHDHKLRCTACSWSATDVNAHDVAHTAVSI